MYKFKKVKRGYVLVLVLFIGLLCISMALYCYKLEMNIRINNNQVKNCLLQKDYLEECREFLFTRLNRQYKQFIQVEQDNEDIISFLDNLSISYKDSKLYYDMENDVIVLSYVYDGLTMQKDSYIYQVENQKINLTYDYTNFEKRE